MTTLSLRTIKASLALLLLCITSTHSFGQQFEEGANCLFIGHSFFIPVAGEFDRLAKLNNYPEHVGDVVFQGGQKGAPGALWNTHRTQIEDKLKTGTVALFGMTAFSGYESELVDYKQWIDLALKYNPDTKFYIGNPWVPEGPSLQTFLYDFSIELTGNSLFNIVKQLRKDYPYNHIFFQNYGKTASNLHGKYGAGQLPDLQKMVGPPETSLFRDNFGHGGNMILETAALTWLNLLYDANISDTQYTNYQSDIENVTDDVLDFNNKYRYQSQSANLAPVAVDNPNYKVNQSLSLSLRAPGVLGNDSDPDGDAITAIKVSDPANGTLTLNSHGAFTYTPNPGFTGKDSFTYKAFDGELESNVATATISVSQLPERSPAKIRTGELLVSTNWRTVTLPVAYRSKVITSSIINDINQPALITRIRNRGPNRFDIKVQRFDGNDDPIENVTLFWMVMEAGTYSAAQTGISMEAHMVTSRVTDRKNSWTGQQLAYQQSYTSPLILGQVISYNDANPSVFWSRGQTKNDPADNSNLHIGKHIGADTNQIRKNEVLGVIVMEAGVGLLKTEDGDLPFEAATGTDAIIGLENSGSTYSLAIQAQKAFVNQAGMDGGEGGWAVHTVRPSMELALAIDEDQIEDSERSHTDEMVSYLALGEKAAPQPSFHAGINLNGDSTIIDGNTWLSMTEARRQGLRLGAGTTLNSTSVMPIDGGDAQSMLQTFVTRENNNLYLSYPVQNGDYAVFLYTMHHSSSQDGRFDLLMEGSVIETDIGIAASEDPGTWRKHGPYAVSVANDILNITLGSNLYNNQDSDPRLMGLTIMKQ